MSLTNEGFSVRRNNTCLGGIEVDCGQTRDPFHACCPSGFTCPGRQTNVVCCRNGETCRPELEASSNPPCANATWDLYDNGGFFCCPPGLTGYNRSNSNGCSPREMVPSSVQILSLIRAGVDPKTFVASSSSAPASASSFSSSLSFPSPSTAASASQTPSSGVLPAPTQITSASEPQSNTAAIAGGVVGGIAGLAAICFLAWLLLRRKNDKKDAAELDANNPYLLQNSSDGHAKYRHEAGSRGLHEADATSGWTTNVELPATQAPVELDATTNGPSEKVRD